MTPKRKQRDDRARLAAAFASQLKPVDAKKAVVAMFKVCPSTAAHLIARGRFLVGMDHSERTNG